MTSALLAMPLWTKVPSEQDIPEMLPIPRQRTSGFYNSLRSTSTEREESRQSQCATSAPSTTLGGFFMEFEEPADLNKNTAWFSSPGIWSTYVLVVMLTCLSLQAFLGCDLATALLGVNAIHFVVTFYLFHWVKGSPFTEDQGVYNSLTWWEQMDGGRQHTTNRKFITLVPVALFLLVCSVTHRFEHSEALLLLNTIMVFVLVVAKLPLLHRIRIFGINA